jgi:hypothetical protein
LTKTAENGSVTQLQTATDGALTVHADALLSAGSCSGAGATVADDSFAAFFQITPCTDAFTLAFTPTFAGAPTGTLHLGGNDMLTFPAPVSAQPVCPYTGGNSNPCPSASLSASYTVTDTSNNLSSPAGQAQLFIVQTQSFSDSAISATTQGRIFDYLQNGCGQSCHNGGNAAWNIGAPGANQVSDTLNNLKNAVCNTEAHNDATVGGAGSHGNNCIEPPGNPPSSTTSATSSVYLNACILDHQTATYVSSNLPFNQPQGAQMCANLLQWLTEGARLK